jgi:hypothetical protein
MTYDSLPEGAVIVIAGKNHGTAPVQVRYDIPEGHTGRILLGSG